MTEPADRITQGNNPALWETLYTQWLQERKPGWVVQRAGAVSYHVVQLTSGSIAFDPTSNQAYYESTSFPG